MSVSVISVKTSPLGNTNHIYKLNFSTFQLPQGVIPLNVIHRVDHKTPKNLNIPMLSTNNSYCSIPRSSPIATLALAGKCEEIQEVGWNQVQHDTARLLPEIPKGTSLQPEPDTKSPLRSIPDADIPEETRVWLQELLDSKYISIVSQTATDIGRTNLIELDIPTEGPPIASKPYTVPSKYLEFVDHEIKQLEEAGIISWSLSDWASPILVVPKMKECAEISSNTSGRSKNSKFNLQLCINYRKLNSQIQTACQIKASGSLGKVISNYPLPTIDSILAHFNKYWSFSILLCSR